jgi:UDP-glucose 4-epimerase
MIKKILVTGGLGFIGSNLVIKLLDLNYKITVIDDLSSGSLNNLSKYHIKKISLIKGSIIDSDLIKRQVSKNDYIFHLAAKVGLKNILQNSVESINVNCFGTENILKFASLYKKKVCIASSSEVYGKSNRRMQKESDDHIIGVSSRLRWGYSVSKLLDEILAFSYQREHNLKVLVVRFFNIVGPSQPSKYGMVIPNFIKQAKNNHPITIFGNGKQKRTFLHVNDAVTALIKLMRKQTFGTVVNLGGSDNISIYQLAKKILKLTKSKSEIKFYNYDYAYSKKKKYSEIYEDIKYRHPSLAKIKKLIKFQPEYNIKKILVDIIKKN